MGFSFQVQLLVALLSGVAFVQSHGAAPGLIRAPDFLSPTTRPCSCDCCQASLRLPSEVQELSNGVKLTHKCTTPEEPTDQCPNLCEMTKDEQVLTAAEGAVDYPRFCLYKCQPTMPTAGTMCTRQAVDESWVAKVPDGNGRGLPTGVASGAAVRPSSYGAGQGPSPALGPTMYTWTSGGYSPAPAVSMDTVEPQKTSWEEAVETKKKERADEVKAAEREGEEKQRTIYDLRKLFTERLRAQAGAMASHEIAAGERVRLSEHNIARNSELLTKAATVAEDLEASIDAAVSQTQANATIARDASAKNDRMFKQGQLGVKSILETTRFATMQMVQQGTQEMAREEAQAFAQRMSWDKPQSYARVLAYRAAEPYQEQMLAASQRVSEYENQASGLFDQAKAAQEQSQNYSSQVTATEASGDKVGAIIEKRKARNLLRTSRDLQLRASRLWDTAQATRATIPQWQNASWVATVHTNWKYENARAAVASAGPCPPAIGAQPKYGVISSEAAVGR